MCAHACEAPDTNARRAKVWGNATALLDNCEEHDEMYLLFYLKVGGKIRCYAGPLLVYILGSYIVFFFVEAIFCVFFLRHHTFSHAPSPLHIDTDRLYR